MASRFCILVLLLGGLAAAAGGCQRAPAAPPAPAVAVTSSTLESAVRDLLGPVPVLRLAEPGTCPGHFDLRASQVAALRQVRLIVRFDFQQALDAKLLGAGAPAVAPIHAEGGLCEPETYRAICAAVADGLATHGLLSPDDARLRLAAVETELRELDTWMQRTIAESRWPGRPVIASTHQAAFCRTLGLDVRATFGAAEAATFNGLNRVLEDGRDARLVVANLPEGRRIADALAERLGVPVVVFGNFPDDVRHGGRVPNLIRDNVRQLVAVGVP